MAKLRNLQYITLDRLQLALDDLLTKRKAALVSFPYGAFIAPDLQATLDKIKALPEAVKTKPFSGDLADLDKTHDGFGAACWFLAEAYLRAPDTTPDQRKALLAIRDVLGTLDDTTAGYDTEAKRAQDRSAQLAGITAALSGIPVAGGKTMLDWAQGYVGAGVAIGEILSKRADAKDRAAANLLRNETVGLLNETRRQLARAAKKDPALPASLDGDIFGWLDELEAKSAEETAEEKKKAAAEKAAAEKAKATAGAPAAPATTGGQGGSSGP
jgi:hypothetical protein